MIISSLSSHLYIHSMHIHMLQAVPDVFYDCHSSYELEVILYPYVVTLTNAIDNR